MTFCLHTPHPTVARVRVCARAMSTASTATASLPPPARLRFDKTGDENPHWLEYHVSRFPRVRRGNIMSMQRAFTFLYVLHNKCYNYKPCKTQFDDSTLYGWTDMRVHAACMAGLARDAAAVEVLLFNEPMDLFQLYFQAVAPTKNRSQLAALADLDPLGWQFGTPHHAEHWTAIGGGGIAGGSAGGTGTSGAPAGAYTAFV